MEINQIRPAILESLGHEAYLKDLDFYKSNRQNFSERVCPACRIESQSTFCIKDSFSYSKCQGCSCIYMNPGPTEELVSQLYRISENYKFWSEYMYPQSRLERLRTIHRERAEWVLSFLSRKFPDQNSFTILEIGAGTGDTLNSILNFNNLQVLAFAIEPNPSMEHHLISNGIQVISYEELLSEECIGKFDAVICFEVLEHLLEPSKLLASLHSNLKIGGHLFASTPNSQSIEVQLLKEKSTSLDIEHISVLSPAGIQALGIRNNFTILEISTPGAFDIELINKAGAGCMYEKEMKKLSKAETQEFVKIAGFSSHMKCILARN